MQSFPPEHLCPLLLLGVHLAFFRLCVFSDPSLSLTLRGTAGSAQYATPSVHFLDQLGLQADAKR